MKNKMSPVILICGGTGVGTSTLARNLVPITGARGVFGTDMMREILRSTYQSIKAPKEDIDILNRSTYDAAYSHKEKDDIDSKKVEGAYKKQCNLVEEAIESVAFRALSENIPIIIEGIHINPGHIRFMNKLENFFNRIFVCVLYISNEKEHGARLFGSSASRLLEKRANPVRYKEYFQEIRIITKYLKARGNRAHVTIDTRSHEDIVKDIFCAQYFDWRKNLVDIPPPFLID